MINDRANTKTVLLVGAAALRVKLLELGKQDGPEVLVRFEICASGSADWAGWIFAVRNLLGRLSRLSWLAFEFYELIGPVGPVGGTPS